MDGAGGDAPPKYAFTDTLPKRGARARFLRALQEEQSEHAVAAAAAMDDMGPVTPARVTEPEAAAAHALVAQQQLDTLGDGFGTPASSTAGVARVVLSRPQGDGFGSEGEGEADHWLRMQLSAPATPGEGPRGPALITLPNMATLRKLVIAPLSPTSSGKEGGSSHRLLKTGNAACRRSCSSKG